MPVAASPHVRTGNELQPPNHLPDNFPQFNESGFATTVAPGSVVDLTGEFFRPQGTNGRSCPTCHVAQNAWSITPDTIRTLFVSTSGTHPIFNPLDADNPDEDLSSAEARLAGYSMMKRHRRARRRGAALRKAPRLCLHRPGTRRPRRLPESRVGSTCRTTGEE